MAMAIYLSASLHPFFSFVVHAHSLSDMINCALISVQILCTLVFSGMTHWKEMVYILAPGLSQSSAQLSPLFSVHSALEL